MKNLGEKIILIFFSTFLACTSNLYVRLFRILLETSNVFLRLSMFHHTAGRWQDAVCCRRWVVGAVPLYVFAHKAHRYPPVINHSYVDMVHRRVEQLLDVIDFNANLIPDSRFTIEFEFMIWYQSNSVVDVASGIWFDEHIIMFYKDLTSERSRLQKKNYVTKYLDNN